VPNLPFQGWFLPLMQRVSEWQPICVTYGYVFSWLFMSSRRAYRRFCTSFGRVGWTVQYAQNVRFWHILQVVGSWVAGAESLRRSGLDRRDLRCHRLMRTITRGLIGSVLPASGVNKPLLCTCCRPSLPDRSLPGT
jgi:hypothetical protein